jgi:hypothetical protein
MAMEKTSAKLADFIVAPGGFDVVFAIPIGYDRCDSNAWVTAHMDGEAAIYVFALQMSACRRFTQQLSSRRVMWINSAVEIVIPCPDGTGSIGQ